MDQTTAMPMVGTSKAELLQADAELFCHTFAYLKSMALNSVVKLGIPDVLHRCGGAASLPELLSSVPLHPSKRPYLGRLMKMLAAAGIFTAEDIPAGGDGAPTTVYHLNTVSRLLVDDAGANRSSCMSPCVLLGTTNLFVSASLRLHQWLLTEEEGATTGSPFMMAHGGSLYGVGSRDPEFNALFNGAMGATSEFVAALAVRECSEVFAGITSLVDVAGGNGTTARTIAEAFPRVKCSVLDLPQVIQGISPDGTVELVAGDMMEFVPPADAVLLKYVLHNWSDEDCVKILRRCRQAISHGAKAGKVIIIDTVVGSPSHQILEGQVTMDLSMMMLFNGKVREEHNWHKMFMEAGFSHYKIHNVLGMRSLIEVHP
ncbi:flavonoid O-methyltransferase-like protein Os11g0303600 [Triticum urartu]|uniref:5-pentadecatrienyl resorcinol O-methyltransferase n=1 Tax=Triticum urartu TaxID=4572 RepID=A0A8R7P5D0_TRIUA|nr:flavonoid O-methyltransferase-like protein Os11g0303600 [Triticum urartu]